MAMTQTNKPKKLAEPFDFADKLVNQKSKIKSQTETLWHKFLVGSTATFWISLITLILNAKYDLT